MACSQQAGAAPSGDVGLPQIDNSLRGRRLVSQAGTTHITAGIVANRLPALITERGRVATASTHGPPEIS